MPQEGQPDSSRRWRLLAGWRKWLLAGFIIALGFGVLVLISDIDGGSAIILKDRSAFQNRVSHLVNALPAVVRNPLRKVKYRFFGPPKLLLVEVFVIGFATPPSFPGATVLEVRGAAPRSNEQGESQNPAPQFLVLPIANSSLFRKQLGDVPGARVISSQQMHVFSGHGARAAVLQNPLPGVSEGLTVEVLPRLRQDLIDLALRAEALAPVSRETGEFVGTKTNVLVSARVNLQRQTGLLVLPAGSTGSSTGIFVLPSLFRPAQ